MPSVVAHLRAAARRAIRPYRRKLDFFLREVNGVIHVGANSGQERDRYARRGLHVAWIEPIPEVFAQLTGAIEGYSKQVAFNRLITDVDGQEYTFHVSNNDGLSSSIFDLAGHKEIWPDVDYARTLKLRSTTLATLVREQNLPLGRYEALVMDTQGSELLVLRGAVPLLPHIKFIKSEVADFECYAGCCQLADMDSFLSEHGFERIRQKEFAHKSGLGACYDVLYASRTA